MIDHEALKSFKSTPIHIDGKECVVKETIFFLGKILSDFNFYFLGKLEINNPIFEEIKDKISDQSIQFFSFSFIEFKEKTESQKNKYLTICFENNCYMLQIRSENQLKYNNEINTAILEKLISRKIHMISSNESDYQQFESLLTMLNSSDIENVKLNKKYFSIISESVDTLYQMCKNSLNDYPIFNISCKSLLTYIIGRFYFKRKYFKNPIFFDFESNEDKIINKNDFIILKSFTSNVRLIYLIQTKQLFIQKSQNVNLIREHSIYKLFKNANNFIKCIGVTTEKNATIESLIIQYMSNGTLLSNIRRALNKNTAKFEKKKILILIEIINQLYMLHTKNVFHRDLKPDNIFIDNNFKAFIGDFGFSLEFNEYHKMTTDIGSNTYSAPETLSKDIHSKESDIYSFGCLIYFIFTNKHFFFDKNNSEVDKLIKNGIENEDIRNIFIKCVKRDPSLRPTACEIMTKMIEISKNLDINLPDILINDFIHTYSKQYNFNGDKDYVYLMIGITLFDGISCQRDRKLGLFYLTLSADEGDADAQIAVFTIYFKGIDVKRDINKSIYYLTLSANQNHVNAMMYLGCYYAEEMFNSIDAEKAIYYLTKAANMNQSDAQCHLGFIYLKGEIVKRSINKAIFYFSLAANQNNPNASYLLGVIYFEGKYVPKDMTKSIYYYTRSANLGHSQASCYLGYIYYNMSPPDINKSLYYLNLSASLDNPNAQSFLGLLYAESKLIPCDINKALYYYELAARKNNIFAFMNLGLLYYEGKLIKQDIDKAIYYFSCGAHLNDRYSQFYLGNIYHEGLYVTKNIPLSIFYLTKSANRNYVKSQFLLGYIYYHEKQFYDIEKSIHYFSLAANQNHLDSIFYLGQIYYQNAKIKNDLKKSVEYWSIAAGQGHIRSRIMLAYFHYEGIYFVKDIKKAISYLIPLAELKVLNAQLFLGYLYLEQKEFYDINKSINYFKLCSEKNDSTAQFNLGFLYYEGKHVKRDINKAIHYFTLAANQNDPISQNYLGRLYDDGKYIPRDINKSIHYFTLSSSLNNSDSLYRLGLIIYYNKFHKIKNSNKLDFHDFKKAFSYWELAANNNFGPAQCALASVYYEGKYIPRDMEKAIHFFKEASNLEISLAKNNLGVIYKNGHGIKSNIDAAIEYFLEGIKLNDFYSIYNYSRILYFDESYQNLNKSIELLEKASKINLIEAQLFLFFIYSRGDEKVKNFKKANKYKELILSKFEFINKILEIKDFKYDPLLFFKSYDLIWLHGNYNFGIHFMHYLLSGEIISDVDENQDEKKYLRSNAENINKYFYDGLLFPEIDFK